MNGETGVLEKIDELGPWFHNLHLPGNVQTAPDHFLGDFPNCKWREIAPALPTDLTGQRVLDIGCNAGFYSFALAERGAEVVGIDMDDRYLAQARWAATVIGSPSVSFERRSVYEVTSLPGKFDIIIFSGVLYHLRHPLLALDLLAELEPKTLVLQTLTRGDNAASPLAREDVDFDTRDRLQAQAWPAMAFIENTFCGDPTNWWVPNHACVLAMLRSAGFIVLAQPGHEIYVCGRRPGGAETFIDEAHRHAARILGLGGATQ
jgi:tRNA (mo5U34)-methyltransferase